jgi:hypothetical protein
VLHISYTGNLANTESKERAPVAHSSRPSVGSDPWMA